MFVLAYNSWDEGGGGGGGSPPVTLLLLIYVTIFFISQENGVSCSKEEIETIFISADKDGSGQLNIKEFIASSKAVNMVKEAENCAAPKSPGLKRFQFEEKDNCFNDYYK